MSPTDKFVRVGLSCIIVNLLCSSVATLFFPHTVWSMICEIITCCVFNFGLLLPLMCLFSNKSLFLRLFSRFTPNSMAVEMITFEGNHIFSIAHCEDGRLVAPVYWFTGIGKCLLRPNGTIDVEGPTSYMFFWLPLDSSLRTEMLLKYDYPDFDQLAWLENRDARCKLMQEWLDERSMAA
jgi:hypothetical protein